MNRQLLPEKVANNNNPYLHADLPTPAQVARAQASSIFPGDPTNIQAIKTLATLGLGGIGIGAGLRSLKGLSELIRKPTELDDDLRLGGPTPVVLRLKRPKRQKKASLIDFLLGRKTGKDGPFGLFSKPFMLPASMALFAGGTYGGYKLLDSLLKQQEEENRKKRLAAAKKLYEKALTSEFEASKLAAKSASSRTLEEDIDLMASHIVKKCGHVKNASLLEWAGAGTGAYLTAAGLLATLSGLAAYKATKEKQIDKIEQALKERQRRRWERQRPEIRFV